MVQAPGRVFHVKQMREIEREINNHPFEGNARFFLVDDADKLNDQSANALLKTLEEPTPTSYLILITRGQPCSCQRFARAVSRSVLSALLLKLSTIGQQRFGQACAAGYVRVVRPAVSAGPHRDLEGYKEDANRCRCVAGAGVNWRSHAIVTSREGLSDIRNKDGYEPMLECVGNPDADALLVAVEADYELMSIWDILPQLKEIASGPTPVSGELDRADRRTARAIS